LEVGGWSANAAGPTTTVVTRLTSAPQVGLPLSVGEGEDAVRLANALGTGTLFTAKIPSGLLDELLRTGLAVRSTTQAMTGVQGTEIRFSVAASEFITSFFTPLPK
jgi:hypothetical protein